MNSDGIVACVVDHDARFHDEVLRWFACLVNLACVPATDLLVLSVEGTRSAATETLEREGVRVCDVARLEGIDRYCNKIAGMRSAADLGDRAVVLTDCDLAFLDDPRRLFVAGALAAKEVDTPNPPISILTRILNEARLPLPKLSQLALVPREHTLDGYMNGGLYAGDASILRPLVPVWERWARWLTERIELLQEWAMHVDQTAMLLATTELATPLHALDIAWNCPTHLKRELPSLATVHALHYHRAVDARGHLKLTHNVTVNAAIARVNAVFDDIRSGMGALR